MRFRLILVAALMAAGSALATPNVFIESEPWSTSFSGNPTNGTLFFATSLIPGWSLAISGNVKPAVGSATSPVLDLSLQLIASSNAPELYITLSERGFGPSSGGFQATLSGAMMSGVGQSISYNTTFQPTYGNAMALTQSGLLAPLGYSS